MTSESPRAVVLLSGGIDSYTCGAIARSEGFVCYGLTIEYGQRHGCEIESARRIAEALGLAEHKVAQLDLRWIGGSALTDEIDVPKQQTGGDEIPVTYVPARNTILLSLALGWAEVLGAFDIYMGANAIDYSGYPDCRGEYIEAFCNMSNLATKAAVEGKGKYRIHTPLIKMSKREIILRGAEWGLDYSLTHSCYDPDDQGRACGRCESCRLRLKGFADAGLTDPVEYMPEVG